MVGTSFLVSLNLAVQGCKNEISAESGCFDPSEAYDRREPVHSMLAWHDRDCPGRLAKECQTGYSKDCIGLFMMRDRVDLD